MLTKENRESRELAKAFRDMERAELLTPSEKAREIVKAREKADARESLRQAAKDMGISAAELASDIIAERTFIAAELPVKESREWEAGITLIESRERRSFVKAMIHTEHATRPDYREARELLDSIGHEKGAVISSTPNGTIAVFATFRAVDSDYATAMLKKATDSAEKVGARISAAELAIEKAPLKKGTPAMQKELADAQRAMAIASKRVHRAITRYENSKAISADGIRLEKVAEWDSYTTTTPGLDSMELPEAIVRRPFKEYVRPRIRRNPISPVECEVLKREAEAEKAIVRAKVAAETEKVLAEKAEAEKVELENKRSAQKASRRMKETMRMRNARNAKRNAR